MTITRSVLILMNEWKIIQLDDDIMMYEGRLAELKQQREVLMKEITELRVTPIIEA